MRTFMLLVLLPWLMISHAATAQPTNSTMPDTWLPSSDAHDSTLLEDDAPAALSAPRLEVGAAYVLWWLREGRIPAALTTSSPASMGLLGRQDTRTLYGDDRLETRHGDRFNGLRFSVAYWFDDSADVGLEGSAFFLERDSTYFKAVSDGSTLLARPYFNTDGSAASEIIAGPAPTGPRSGGYVGYSRVELFGQESNLVALLGASQTYRVEVLGGARFLQLRDRTDLTSAGRSLPDQETLFGQADHYRTGNAFYGGQVGLRGEALWGRWTLQAKSAVGLGANVEQVRAFGGSLFQTPLERLETSSGLTVQASNTGTFNRTALNVVGELGLTLSCQLTQHVRVSGGYTFLLWDGALRSGDQIDLTVNTNPGAGPGRPGIPFKEDLFWAQGLNGGVAVSW